MKKTLVKATLLLGVMGQFSCNNLNNDVAPNNGPELGRWRVEYYDSFNTGLDVPGAVSTQVAKQICDYLGDGKNSVVYLNLGGVAVASFKKNGSNNWNSPTDGRTVEFSRPAIGWSAYNASEEKGTTKLYRQYNNSLGAVEYNVTVSAGNEKAVNLIPKTDFISNVEYDEVSGLTKATLGNVRRENRYVRLRTDYVGREKRTSVDANGNTQTRWVQVILTDLYQIDCGSTPAGGRIAAPSENIAPDYRLVRTAEQQNLVLRKEAVVGAVVKSVSRAPIK